MENDKHTKRITLDSEYFERATKRAKLCGFSTKKKVTVMEVKEDD